MKNAEKIVHENIHEALTGINCDITAIGKDSKNESQGFKFRGIDAVMNALHPLFAKHGVVITSKIIDHNTDIRLSSKNTNLYHHVSKIEFSFQHEKGTHIEATVAAEAMDSGDKAIPKTYAIALKYCLTQMFLMPYDEIDPDGDTPEDTISPKTTDATVKAVKNPIPPPSTRPLVAPVAAPVVTPSTPTPPKPATPPASIQPVPTASIQMPVTPVSEPLTAAEQASIERTFKVLGVSVKHLESWADKKLTDFAKEDQVRARELWKALKAGTIPIAEFLDVNS